MGRTPLDAFSAVFAGMMRACPKCGETKAVIPDFGLRRTGIKADGSDRVRPQPWCRACCSGAAKKGTAQAERKARTAAKIKKPGAQAERKARTAAAKAKGRKVKLVDAATEASSEEELGIIESERSR